MDVKALRSMCRTDDHLSYLSRALLVRCSPAFKQSRSKVEIQLSSRISINYIVKHLFINVNVPLLIFIKFAHSDPRRSVRESAWNGCSSLATLALVAEFNYRDCRFRCGISGLLSWSHFRCLYFAPLWCTWAVCVWMCATHTKSIFQFSSINKNLLI